MSKVFNLAFKSGLLSFLVLLVMGALMLTSDLTHGAKSGTLLLPIFQVIAFVASVLILVSTLLLWIEGWMLLIQGLTHRSWILSVLLVGFLVFFNVIAAYLLHFLRTQRNELAS